MFSVALKKKGISGLGFYFQNRIGFVAATHQTFTIAFLHPPVIKPRFEVVMGHISPNRREC